ncbi:50S ribosomal protein L4 [candidate division SR1 bacterium Aalborg_AAW-1]|nr:50S ribosomal protein L4 [candidate division SR1 bacterium Aalborg_AAW-1]
MSFTIDIFNQQGKKTKTIDLDASVFASENINNDLMYQFVRLQQANSRVAIASTKNRGEVNGSGKKLYKQKGNGAGRVGDKKSPLRKKGGIARGPRSNRNFSLSMPKKMRKASLRSALSFKASQEGLVALDSFDVSKISTKSALTTLKNIQLDRSVLVVVHDSIETIKSYRNLPFVDVVDALYVSVFDVLKAKKVLFVGEALDKIVEYNKKKA